MGQYAARIERFKYRYEDARTLSQYTAGGLELAEAIEQHTGERLPLL